MRADLAQRLQSWLFDECLPFWIAHAWDDARGGFVEEFLQDGADAGLPQKRLRVAPRQIYVFSHAALLGAPNAAPLIAKGAQWLIDKGWMADKGAFAHRLTRDGAIADPTIDLYDHAFVMYGFAWAYAATGEPGYREWLGRALDAIERHLAAPGAGFLSNPGTVSTRDQNPHMHLLEAALAAYEATADVRYRDVARSLVALARQSIIRVSDGALFEHFDAQWRPADGAAGRRVEPGHQFEWIWLLHQAEAALDIDCDAEISALARAAAGGVNPVTGFVYNAIDVDGGLIDGASRSWTQTERLKAGVALMERGDAAATEAGEAAFEGSALALLDGHLARREGLAKGLWIELFDAAGTPQSKTAPASIVYHLMLAIAEATRWRAELRA